MHEIHREQQLLNSTFSPSLPTSARLSSARTYAAKEEASRQSVKMPAIRGANSKKKTRRYTRDLDQIHADQQSKKHLQQFKDTKALEDLPGFGEFYCTECAKWFESETNYQKHGKGKPHKRRVRQLKEEPYSQKEAEAAIGLTTDTDNIRKAREEEAMDETEV